MIHECSERLIHNQFLPFRCASGMDGINSFFLINKLKCNEINQFIKEWSEWSEWNDCWIGWLNSFQLIGMGYNFRYVFFNQPIKVIYLLKQLNFHLFRKSIYWRRGKKQIEKFICATLLHSLNFNFNYECSVAIAKRNELLK